MQEDPLESRNLIFDPRYTATVTELRQRLFDTLERTGGMNIPLQRDRGAQQNLRNSDKRKGSDFPPELYKKPPGPAEHK